MSFLSQLPASVPQAGAIFLYYHWSPAFVFDWALFLALSGVCQPDKVYRFPTKNKWARIFFWSLVGLSPILRVRNRPYYKSVSGKESSWLHGCSMVTAPVINPIVLLATYSAFGNSLRMALLRALGFYGRGYSFEGFSGLLLRIAIFKRKSQGCSWAWLSHLQGTKLFRYLCRPLTNFSILVAIWSLAVSFASLVQVYVPNQNLDLISQHQLLLFSYSCCCPSLLSLCKEADAFIGELLDC